MKVLYDFTPSSKTDSSLILSASSENANFPVDNLKELSPVKCWKSSALGIQYVTYDFKGSKTFNGIFINRFNFASFTVKLSDDVNFVTGVTDINVTAAKDELYDENYMHMFIPVTGSYAYMRIYIPSQTPLFESTYYKIGNLYVGNFVDIWNPKPGYSVSIISKENQIDYDSGSTDSYQVGRTRRLFEGQFDKISDDEYKKLRFTRNPFVLFHDWEVDNSKCYLVKSLPDRKRSYDYSKVTSHSFSFLEIV